VRTQARPGGSAAPASNRGGFRPFVVLLPPPPPPPKTDDDDDDGAELFRTGRLFFRGCRTANLCR